MSFWTLHTPTTAVFQMPPCTVPTDVYVPQVGVLGVGLRTFVPSPYTSLLQVGHEVGQCAEACTTCGWLHEPPLGLDCQNQLCSECQLWGHDPTVCPDAQCNRWVGFLLAVAAAVAALLIFSPF